MQATPKILPPCRMKDSSRCETNATEVQATQGSPYTSSLIRSRGENVYQQNAPCANREAFLTWPGGERGV